MLNFIKHILLFFLILIYNNVIKETKHLYTIKTNIIIGV